TRNEARAYSTKLTARQCIECRSLPLSPWRLGGRCLGVLGQCRACRRWGWLRLIAISLGCADRLCAQTASTGAVTGLTLDPSGAVLPGVAVRVTKEGGSEAKSAISDVGGRFGFLLVPPGTYTLQAEKADFQQQLVLGACLKIDFL